MTRCRHSAVRNGRRAGAVAVIAVSRLDVEEDLARGGPSLIDGGAPGRDEDVEHVQRYERGRHATLRPLVDEPRGEIPAAAQAPMQALDGGLAHEIEVAGVALAARERHDEVLARARQHEVALALALDLAVELQALRQRVDVELHAFLTFGLATAASTKAETSGCGRSGVERVCGTNSVPRKNGWPGSSITRASPSASAPVIRSGPRPSSGTYSGFTPKSQ